MGERKAGRYRHLHYIVRKDQTGVMEGRKTHQLALKDNNNRACKVSEQKKDHATSKHHNLFILRSKREF